MVAGSDNSLGSVLREERLRKKLDLAAVAQQTRICTAILEAIETDRLECIPGGAYRRHFIRQYACALGMDAEATVAEFRKQHEELPLPLPIPPKTRHSSLWADLGWAVVVAAALASGYQIMQTKRGAMKHFEQLLAQAEVVHQAEQRPLAATPPQAPPLPTPQTAAPPAPASVHVAFLAIEPVWISVKCDGNASYAGVLEVPQSKTFDATAEVTAIVGNAGGLQISLNGKPVGPLGKHGEVQMVELTLNGARRIPRPAAPTSDPATVPQF